MGQQIIVLGAPYRNVSAQKRQQWVEDVLEKAPSSNLFCIQQPLFSSTRLALYVNENFYSQENVSRNAAREFANNETFSKTAIPGIGLQILSESRKGPRRTMLPINQNHF